MRLLAPGHLRPDSEAREDTAPRGAVSRVTVRRGLVCILVAAAASLTAGCSDSRPPWIRRPRRSPPNETPRSATLWKPPAPRVLSSTQARRWQ